MKVVSPFRPFAPESSAHLALGAFDWVGALQMLRASVRQHCDCETYAITDIDTDLPGPTYQYVTHERRLMLWLLEVTLCYLRSDDFDQDTILISPDALVCRDLQSVPALIQWGADTESLVQLLMPMETGPFVRGGLSVFGFDAAHAFRPVAHPAEAAIVPVIDFKGRRKHGMAQTYAALGLPPCA